MLSTPYPRVFLLWHCYAIFFLCSWYANKNEIAFTWCLNRFLFEKQNIISYFFYRYPGNYITYKFNWHLTLKKMVWQRHCWISLYFNQRSSAGLILFWYISFVILRNLSVIHYFHNNNKSYPNKFLSIVEY